MLNFQSPSITFFPKSFFGMCRCQESKSVLITFPSFQSCPASQLLSASFQVFSALHIFSPHPQPSTTAHPSLFLLSLPTPPTVSLRNFLEVFSRSLRKSDQNQGGKIWFHNPEASCCLSACYNLKLDWCMSNNLNY